MPTIKGVVETVLYTRNMRLARYFFESVMGLTPHTADHRFTAYALEWNMLLLFADGETSETVELPGDMGTIPPHDGSGRQHIAFAIAADALDDWAKHLQANDIAIEGQTRWPKGAVSLYFRDPDGHLLELVTPGIWPNY
ncbi:glyoxalase/bleomycin resistance protein/dioxygenase [Salinisphaera shabanensis T35B1]|uniref:VOC family protein n=1 Tax=Salinisphaera shabanensis TaxID=180542 RepID=UPI003341F50E|tara:strand:- start:492 stop:908 length:417 start_codon:yes stop_codon:yes gene_type:complete